MSSSILTICSQYCWCSLNSWSLEGWFMVVSWDVYTLSTDYSTIWSNWCCSFRPEIGPLKCLGLVNALTQLDPVFSNEVYLLCFLLLCYWRLMLLFREVIGKLMGGALFLSEWMCDISSGVFWTFSYMCISLICALESWHLWTGRHSYICS